MPDCDYCSASFDDEDEYLQHLADTHEGELGAIDRRRVEQATEETDPNDALYTGIGVVLALVIAGVVGYVLFFSGGSGENGGLSRTGPAFDDPVRQPSALGSVHYHGQIAVVIDGQRLDFTRPVFQNPRQNPYFHFESGTDRWHVHGRGVTLEYALQTVYVGVADGTVTFRGETYRESEPGVTIRFLVDGKPVDPQSYVLQPGDRIRVVVRTGVAAHSPTPTSGNATTSGRIVGSGLSGFSGFVGGRRHRPLVRALPV